MLSWWDKPAKDMDKWEKLLFWAMDPDSPPGEYFGTIVPVNPDCAKVMFDDGSWAMLQYEDYDWKPLQYSYKE